MPLFTGISGDDLALIMDRVELIDITLTPGEVFVRQGDTCQGMAMVRSGLMQRTTCYEMGTFVNQRKQICPVSYNATETLQPSYIIEPEILFALQQQHQSTWSAQTTCEMTLISKDDIRQTLMYVPVWRINFINMLSTNVQKNLTKGLPKALPTLRQQVIEHLLRHSSERGITLEMDISIEQLAHCLGAERRAIARVLNELETDHLLEKHKQRFFLPSLIDIRQAK